MLNIFIVLTILIIIFYNIKPRRKKRVLFLCTGNYYRSRVAEEIFNHFTKKRRIPYDAFSRGLDPNVEKSGNIGPIAPFAVSALSNLQIVTKNVKIWPKSVNSKDIKSAEIVIALNESEHRPLIEKYFPQFLDKIIYWNIADVYEQQPSVSIKTIYRNVETLLSNLNDTMKT